MYDHRYDDYRCYVCTGYGENYSINEYGEIECACPLCPYNRHDDDKDSD